MSVADAPAARKPRRKTGASGEARAEAHIPPDLIDPNPWQPRQEFDPDALRELAREIEVCGLMQPPRVRVHPTDPLRYQLVYGERRLRAVRDVLGWLTIPCLVSDLTDAQMRRLSRAENAARQDLNPIERARELQAMLDAGDAPTQQALGAMLGVSQGEISNTLRLLRLPAAAQELIAAGKMSATNGRTLAAWADHPALCGRVLERLADEEALDATSRDFAAQLGRALWDETRPMGRDEAWMIADRRAWVEAPTVRPEQQEALALVEVPPRYQGARPTRRASNVELWEQLAWEQHERREAARAKREAKAEKGAKGEGRGAKGKESSAEEAARKAEEQARQFGKRLWAWYCDWLRYLVAEAIEETDQWPRLLLWAAAETVISRPYVEEVCGGKRRGYGDRLADVLGRLDAADVEPALRRYLAALFWETHDEGGGPVKHVVDADVVTIATKWLGIHLEANWLTEQAGPLSRDYWELHTSAQLDELAAELKVPGWDAGAKKGAKVAALLAQLPAADSLDVGLPLPKEIKRVKPPKH